MESLSGGSKKKCAKRGGVQVGNKRKCVLSANSRLIPRGPKSRGSKSKGSKAKGSKSSRVKGCTKKSKTASKPYGRRKDGQACRKPGPKKGAKKPKSKSKSRK